MLYDQTLGSYVAEAFDFRVNHVSYGFCVSVQEEALLRDSPYCRYRRACKYARASRDRLGCFRASRYFERGDA